MDDIEALRAKIERLSTALEQGRINDQCVIDEAIAAATKLKQAEIERLREDNADMKRTLDAPIPWLLERDLRAEIERLREEECKQHNNITKLMRERDELLAALQPFARLTEGVRPFWDDVMRARAAIANAERK